jgi:hypothetical protein
MVSGASISLRVHLLACFGIPSGSSLHPAICAMTATYAMSKHNARASAKPRVHPPTFRRVCQSAGASVWTLRIDGAKLIRAAATSARTAN